jgi:hypothetical protein
LWQHLLERVDQRKIPLSDLQLLQDWVKMQPNAPEGDWYKGFSSLKLCGSGEYPKTFLTKGMTPYGEKIN